MQADTLFITATGTGVGKTYTTRLLLEVFAKQGVRPGVIKPIETGVETTALDATILYEVCRKVNDAYRTLTPDQITSYTFPLPAAPFCADKEGIIRLEKIFEDIRRMKKLCDVLIIEGAGGLMVPILRDFFMIDLIKQSESFALLVTPSKLGCINETELSLKALEAYKIPHGWCVNLYEEKESFDAVTRPYYDAAYPGWWSLQEGLETFAKRWLKNGV